MVRRLLTFTERMEISTGSKAGWGVRRIASHLGRCPSVVSRELRRNSTRRCQVFCVRGRSNSLSAG
ncbi:MAG: helix-turn-helix domain-containing protein, partial [Brachybacterium tyrofermentans]|uniref:helix-turn-helix domain-containing protein n=1 Tax=Brachybacterium tyrofermentans TaxID=47848 RepID=UPI003F906B2D